MLHRSGGRIPIRELSYWIQAWVDLATALATIVSLGFYAPGWGLAFACWNSRVKMPVFQ